MDDNNGQVIAVYPDKVKISVDDLKDYESAGKKLKVGSYIRISDNDNAVMIAIIENFTIEVSADKNGDAQRRYILEAHPLGMIINGKFERGGDTIAIPPKNAEPATDEDINLIYENSLKETDKFVFSTLSSNKDIQVPADGNKFFNKHIAIVGSTGSGKSHTVAKILQQAVNSKEGTYDGLNNSHIIIFDIHSEYKTAFPKANYIDITNLSLPYWMMNSDELQDLFIESDGNDYRQRNVFKEAIVSNKKMHYEGENKERIHFDSPVKFNIREVLQYLINRNNEKKDKEHNNNICYKISGGTQEYKELSKENNCDLFSIGIEYKGTATDTLNGKLVNFINRLENKINDKRFGFLFGQESTDITFEDTLKQLMGYGEEEPKKSNVTILDLSGVPFEVLSITVSLISRILFDYGYYYKRVRFDQNPEETLNNDVPLLLVYEEAHKYVPNNDMAKYRASRESIERIAKEGRKYGVTLLLASQRPSEISETIFSQCNNFITLRLTNPNDQNYVKKLLPDTMGSLVDKLPTLQDGHALLIGDSIVMPSMVHIDRCDPAPSSNSIPYYDLWKQEWKELDLLKIKEEWMKK